LRKDLILKNYVKISHPKIKQLSLKLVPSRKFNLSISFIFRTYMRSEDEIEAISLWLQKIKSFRNLPLSVLKNLAGKIKSVEFSRNQVSKNFIISFFQLISMLPRRSR